MIMLIEFMKNVIIIFVLALLFCVLFLNQAPLTYSHSNINKINEFDNFEHKIITNVFPKSEKIIPEKINNIENISIKCNGIVIDDDSNEILFSQNENNIEPIASITKLATVLVFLENNPDFEKKYKITKKDRIEGGKIYLYQGDEVKIKDLLFLSLVGSANTATMALVNASGIEKDKFILAMNEKMKELGLEKTNFVDPIGLGDKNISTAKEIARLVQFAMNNDYILKTTQYKKYEFITSGNRKVVVNNTNEILNKKINNTKNIGGKTGWTESAGYCFGGKFTNFKENNIISVILGCKQKYERFTESEKMVEWVYNSYRWNN